VSAPNVLAGATDLPRLLLAVVAAAEAAGRLLAAEFARPGGPRGAGSHADIDHEIEVGLRQRLLELLPARWMGEETGADPGPGGAACWVVDPNDGTSAFLAGHRGSAVCIALLRGGVPVLGVVHAPISPDRGPDTIAWVEGMDHLLRNGECCGTESLLRRGPRGRRADPPSSRLSGRLSLLRCGDRRSHRGRGPHCHAGRRRGRPRWVARPRPARGPPPRARR
jgi:hypothetical protein